MQVVEYFNKSMVTFRKRIGHSQPGPKKVVGTDITTTGEMIARNRKYELEFNLYMVGGDATQLEQINKMTIFAYLAMVDKFTNEVKQRIKK